MYKILTKLLANRWAKVVSSVIPENQSDFAGNKHILDSILILNKTVDFVNRGKQKEIVFKVNFEKAYNSVVWDFVNDMMRGVNFHWKWRKSMRGYLSSTSMSVLVNGSPTGEFQLQK